jgi:5-methylthioadenosine/S-adenosylhomocysteine deaminase
MPETTCIRNADWIVAWDSTSEQLAYLTGGDVAFSGDTISFVGRGYTGTAERVIDGRGVMLIPGLVNIHSHPATEPYFRGVREEHGVPAMYMSGLYERSQAFRPDLEGRQAAREVAYCEMLLSGITTVADLSAH